MTDPALKMIYFNKFSLLSNMIIDNMIIDNDYFSFAEKYALWIITIRNGLHTKNLIRTAGRRVGDREF